MKIKSVFLALLFVPLMTFGQKKYEPNWESLDTRPIPQWFFDAKFGIFIHWGPYSVPAWAPKGCYEEWYQSWLQNKRVGGNFNPPSTAVFDYHKRTYGEHFSYYNFGEMFTLYDWKPEEWAKLFVDAGAKYIVLTSKHHDGFTLWPSKEADKNWGFPWSSMTSGPKRDIIGDLSKEVRKTDVKFGLYYSLYEWYNPLYLKDKAKYVEEHFLPQVKDLVLTYEPDILWGDGDWTMKSEEWKAPEFIAWLYNESPLKNKILVNNRWGGDVRKIHGSYRTSEFGASGKYTGPWEENRGMGFSFGFNRNEDVWDYNSEQVLILLLVDIVAHGGNFLLDIGPDGNGKIPPIMQERLLQIGNWLKINGEAIYGTRMWKNTVQWSKGEIVFGNDYKKKHNLSYLGGDFILKQTLTPDEGMAVKEIFFTRKGNTVYAMVPKLPEGSIRIKDMPVTADTRVTLIGYNQNLSYQKAGNDIVVTVPVISRNKLPDMYAYAFRITNVNAE